ncbi:MAG: hypothetical protein Q8N18_10275 [Opitutaceae bacterium]|nr:hypothetical protein [Opitutaceae bacterium]
MDLRVYSVSRARKEPLVRFIREALENAGCRILHEPDPSVAPYRFTFETPEGERLGIIVYAFFANSQPTRNRPDDEHRFQVKYSSKTGSLHHLWQDPYMLYTTLFCGIDLESGIFVAADPILHTPIKLPLTLEFSSKCIPEIQRKGWIAWEFEPRDGPIEIVVTGTANHFLRLARFEREALREDTGIRHMLADRAAFDYFSLTGPIQKLPMSTQL